MLEALEWNQVKCSATFHLLVMLHMAKASIPVELLPHILSSIGPTYIGMFGYALFLISY